MSGICKIENHPEEICPVNRRQPQKPFNIGRVLKKISLSAFVVFSFILYAAHKSVDNSGAALIGDAQAPGLQQVFTPTQPPPSTDLASVAPTPQGDANVNQPATLQPAPTAVPQQALVPTQAPPPTATSAPSRGQYKDGTYQGPAVDAFYGMVQVQAVIQNGKIKTVQFLQYPNDRRTSVRINQVAVPYLQQEAMQVQSANVDIISGATLTSEGFIMSLQAALANAHS
jgi:uncharacterized protein with FMN-binding domain